MTLPQDILEKVVSESRKALGGILVSVVLYGSFARGDNTPESDLDVALFVRRELNRQEHKDMVACFSQLCMDYDMVFSPHDIVVEKYEQWVSVLPFYRNIRREGIVLWTA